MNYEIKVCLEEYGKVLDKSQDWLILSWSETNKYERMICLLKYHKYRQERKLLAKRLSDLTETAYGSK